MLFTTTNDGEEKMKTRIWNPRLSTILTDDIGKGCVIHSHVWIGKDVKIGDRVKIQAFSFIPEGVTLEGDVFIGPRVTFTNDPELICGGRDFWKPTLVKRGAKIGACVCVLAGVTIGQDVMVGMGSVVLTNIPNGETWAGVPARRIK